MIFLVCSIYEIDILTLSWVKMFQSIKYLDYHTRTYHSNARLVRILNKNSNMLEISASSHLAECV